MWLAPLAWALLACGADAALMISSATGQGRTLTSYSLAFGNASFVVEAPAATWYPGRNVSGQVAVVEIRTFATSLADWADECTALGCVGLVLYVSGPGSQLQTMMQLTAWWYWVPHADTLARLPIVIAIDDVGDVAVGDTVRMSSTDPDDNPAAAALLSPVTTNVFAGIAILNMANVLLAMARFLASIVDENGRWRRAPAPGLLAIVLIVASQMITAVKCANIAWRHDQGLPFNALVYTLVGNYPFSSLARLCISVALKRAKQDGAEPAALLQAVVDRGVQVLAVSLIALMLVVSVASAVTETIPTGAVATWLLFLSTSVLFSVASSRDALAILKRLLVGSAQLGLPGAEYRARIDLRRRMATALALGYLFLACQVVFVCVQNRSPMHFLMAYAAQTTASSMQATSALYLVRVRSSRLDWWCTPPRLRRAAPVLPQTR
ncbi:Uncharacterized protein PBTT_10263 [Plasmodiophora brassicae]